MGVGGSQEGSGGSQGVCERGGRPGGVGYGEIIWSL